MNTEHKTTQASHIPTKAFTMEHTPTILGSSQPMTLKSKSLPLTKAKAEIVKHKEVEANKIQKVKDELNPIDCITTGVEELWKTVFPKAHIFYTKPEDLPDSLELNEGQCEELKHLKEALSKYIGFLRRELSPVILQSKIVQDEMKLKYACLRENTTYYGQKTESKLEQSYSMADLS